MHELSVTQAILGIALRNAAKSNAIRVTGLNITIGDLSSFVDDSIQFYWDLISKGTLCEGRCTSPKSLGPEHLKGL
jgi:hydrogenase nickel incorporation protein HypA/HybF